MSEQQNLFRNGFSQMNEDEDTIDLLELFYALLDQWKVIALSTILVAAIAFVYCKVLVTPLYESTSELYVLTKSTSITSLADLQIGSNLSDDYQAVIGGRPVVDQVSSDLDLGLNYTQLKNKIKITNLSDRIIAITVTDADPNQAKAIADQMAEVSAAYIAQKMDQDPPSIIQNGYADGKPVSPQTRKTTLIGAILGFLAAAGIIVLQSILNDTVMTPEDVETKLGINVLGTLPLEEGMEGGRKKSRKSNHKKKKSKRW